MTVDEALAAFDLEEPPHEEQDAVECLGCGATFSIDDEHTWSPICDTCAQTVAELLASEVVRLRRQIAASAEADLVKFHEELWRKEGGSP